MPVTKSANKKLRQDKKRQLQNSRLTLQLKSALKAVKKHTSQKTVRVAEKMADKAVKKGVIHKNKAARIKSSLAKLVSQKTTSRGKK